MGKSVRINKIINWAFLLCAPSPIWRKLIERIENPNRLHVCVCAVRCALIALKLLANFIYKSPDASFILHPSVAVFVLLRWFFFFLIVLILLLSANRQWRGAENPHNIIFSSAQDRAQNEIENKTTWIMKKKRIMLNSIAPRLHSKHAHTQRIQSNVNTLRSLFIFNFAHFGFDIKLRFP